MRDYVVNMVHGEEIMFERRVVSATGAQIRAVRRDRKKLRA